MQRSYRLPRLAAPLQTLSLLKRSCWDVSTNCCFTYVLENAWGSTQLPWAFTLTWFKNEREVCSGQLHTVYDSDLIWQSGWGRDCMQSWASWLPQLAKRYTLLHTMFHCCTGEILHCCSTNSIVARNTRCCIVAILHCWTQYTAVASHTRPRGCTLRFAVSSHTILHCRTPYLIVAS